MPDRALRPAEDEGPSLGGLYRNVWRYAAGAKVQLVFSSLLLVGSQVLKLAVPWFAAQAINALQRGRAHAVAHAATFVALVLLTYVAAWAMHGPGRILERAVGLRIRQGISDALFAKLMRLPMTWHDQHHSGDMQQRVGQATGALYGFAQNQFVYLQTTVSLVGPVIALTLFYPTLGMVAMAGYLVVGLAILRFDGVLMRLATVEIAAERRYQGGLLDYLGNVSTVLSLRLQANTRRLLGERMKAIFVPLKKSILLNETKWCAVDLLSVALVWSLVATYVWLKGRHGGPLLVGSLFMVYQYSQQASGVMGAIAGNYQGFARTRTEFASADCIWSAAERHDSGQAVAPGWHSIELRDLCYAHPVPIVVADPDEGSTDETVAQAPPGLHHVTMVLGRSDRVALVGPSGSGKSTLLKVLAGLYVARQPTIVVDGEPQTGLHHVGSISTFIPQEAEVFEATVRENIAFGGDCTDAAILQAIGTSAFDDVMMDMAAGLDTPISERGFNLSGGQRQRLCLARGLLAARASSLVLLDEPTSALDPVTEEAVFARLCNTFSGACLVVSVHRLSLLHHFTKVVLMDEGKVTDAGTTEELLARQPMFRQMLKRSEPHAALTGM